MTERLTLVQRGKVVKREEVKDAPIVAAGSGLPDKRTGYVFDTEDQFHGWTREIGVSEVVDRLDEATAKGQEYQARADEKLWKTWQTKRVQRITDDLNNLAEMHGLPVTSPELFLKATVDAHPVLGPVFDPYVIFDREGCGGGFLPLVGTMPKFGWFGYNNKASSVNGLGGGTLFSRYWFKGKRLYLISIGNELGQCINLADLDYNNMASSAIVL
jgi:hypothetical protein